MGFKQQGIIVALKKNLGSLTVVIKYAPVEADVAKAVNGSPHKKFLEMLRAN